MFIKPPQGGGTKSLEPSEKRHFIICRPLRGLDEYFILFSTGSTRGYVPSSPAGIKDTKTTIFLDDELSQP